MGLVGGDIPESIIPSSEMHYSAGALTVSGVHSLHVPPGLLLIVGQIMYG
jgi:hypothetical protein